MERQKKFPCMKSLIIGRCQKIRKLSVLDAFGAQPQWANVHLYVHPPGQKPQSSLSRPCIYQMEPRISSLRHETSPPRPEISSLRLNISPHRPKISLFQTDIRLLRDCSGPLLPLPLKYENSPVLCRTSVLWGCCPALTQLPSKCKRAGHWVPLTI